MWHGQRRYEALFTPLRLIPPHTCKKCTRLITLCFLRFCLRCVPGVITARSWDPCWGRKYPRCRCSQRAATCCKVWGTVSDEQYQRVNQQRCCHKLFDMKLHVTAFFWTLIIDNVRPLSGCGQFYEFPPMHCRWSSICQADGPSGPQTQTLSNEESERFRPISTSAQGEQPGV